MMPSMHPFLASVMPLRTQESYTVCIVLVFEILVHTSTSEQNVDFMYSVFAAHHVGIVWIRNNSIMSAVALTKGEEKINILKTLLFKKNKLIHLHIHKDVDGEWACVSNSIHAPTHCQICLLPPISLNQKNNNLQQQT